MKERLSEIRLVALAALLVVCAHNSPVLLAQAPSRPLSGYAVITVEKVDVGTLSLSQGFPQGLDGVIQKNAVAKLATSKLFENVLDATDPVAEAAGAAASEQAGRRVTMSGTVIGYDPGSRAARVLVGFGSGSAKVTVRFIFRDAQTGAELFRTDKEGKFAGTSTIGGGSTATASGEAARKVVDGLIKDIQKNR